MRIDVKKFLFIGSKVDQASFFQEAQKTGIIEFIQSSEKKAPPLNEAALRYATAIKTLRGYLLGEQVVRKDKELAQKIVTEVLALKEEKTKAEEELRRVEQEIKRIKPFGYFSHELIASIENETKKKVRFYAGKSTRRYETLDPELIPINSQDGIDFFFSIQEEPVQLRDLIEEEIPESLASLEERAKIAADTIQKKDASLKNYTRFSWLMHFALLEEMNQIGFEFASSAVNTTLDETVFVVEGWVPKNKIELLGELTGRFHVYMEEVAIGAKDTLPTFLENKGLHRVGEDLVHVFDVPSPTDKDPSIWLLSCFSLFFAMIVGDAGYGLIFLFAALFMRYKIKNLKGLMKRFVTLVTVLSISCILWGTMMNSFFSMKMSEDNPLRRYSLITYLLNKKADYHLAQKDDVYQFWIEQIPELKKAKTGQEFMEIASRASLPELPADRFTMNIGMELALMVGCIHVILGLLRYIRKNPTGAGWMAFIIGAYLYLPKYLDATSILNFVFGLDKDAAANVGVYLMALGVPYSLVVAIVRGGILGVFEVMTAIQIFADILSYLRIFALGLAGSIVAATTNDLASQMPLVLGIIVMVLAHFVNILLSIMGGVIHGLRLNFLEWYHYSFEGGGKQFKPLELHTID